MTEATMNLGVALNDGGSIPVLGLGTWELTGDEAYDAVRAALDIGYRHIDTATMYGNEDVIGRALADSAVAREDIFITTKLPAERVGREKQTLDASLHSLGIEYVDLWLIHWPPRGGAAPETWREFIAARGRGQARSIGVSNYTTAQIDELIAATGVTPAVNQIPWSPRDYDAAVVGEHVDRGVVLEGYSAFKRTKLDHPVLRRVADAHGVQPTQVLLRWHVQHEFVAIPKSAKPERLAANFDIWEFSLSPEELASIDALAG